jgi:hypothetical protein
MALCNLTIFNTVEQLRDIETGCCVQQAHQVPRAYICDGCQSAGKVTTRKQKEQLIYQQTCNDALRLACLLRSSRLIEASNYHMTIGWLDAWIGKVVQQQQSRAKPKRLLDYDDDNGEDNGDDNDDCVAPESKRSRHNRPRPEGDS